MRQPPKGEKDWLEDIREACYLRYRYAQRKNKVSQTKWKCAWDALRASQQSIYLQKGGEKKGLVVGIPKKIRDPAIIQTIHNIVKEDEPETKPER